MPGPTLSPLDELIRLVEEVSGIAVPDRDRGSVERIALEQARRSGAGELEPYVRALRSNLEGAEWQALLSRITVKESYLFRGPQQLRALADHVLPGLVAGRPRGRALRVWSAGCARGEEPTTLAMVLAESSHLVGRDWRILATDVDESALGEARRAVFGRRAVAGVPDPLLERHMVARGGGAHELVERLRARIDFRVVNLVSRPLLLPEAPFDLVFLRNVLIYFRPEQQRRVVRAVVEALAPDGYLFLGPAESLWQLATGLVPLDLGDCFCYRRPHADGPPATSSPPHGERPKRPEAPRGGPIDEGEPEDGGSPSPAAGTRPRPGPRARQAPELGPLLSALEQGRARSARALVRGAISAFPDNPALRVLEGLAHELESDQRGAVRCYRAALYLDPGLFQARFLLARGLDRTGWAEQAQRAYREALAIAEQVSPADELPGTGTAGLPSTRQLIEGCRNALSQASKDDGDQPGGGRSGSGR